MNGFGATAGAALASHERVQKIAFTGSTAVSIHGHLIIIFFGTIENNDEKKC